MTTLKKTILCPCCGEGNAKLKYEDHLFFYTCDTCMSDFSNSECATENIRIGKILGMYDDYSQGKYDPSRRYSGHYFLFVLMSILCIFSALLIVFIGKV